MLWWTWLWLRLSGGWALELEDRKLEKKLSRSPELSAQLSKLKSSVDSESCFDFTKFFVRQKNCGVCSMFEAVSLRTLISTKRSLFQSSSSSRSGSSSKRLNKMWSIYFFVWLVEGMIALAEKIDDFFVEESKCFLVCEWKTKDSLELKLFLLDFCFKFLQRFLLDDVSNSFNRYFDLTTTVKAKQMIVLLATAISCLYFSFRKLSKTRAIATKLSQLSRRLPPNSQLA